MALSENSNWKGIVGHGAPEVSPAQNDDDWDTDPDFVNAVDEKKQRWAPNQHSGDSNPRTNFDLEQLRQNVIDNNFKSSLTNYVTDKGGDVKKSYGVKQTDSK